MKWHNNHLKEDHGKLTMYTIKPKANTKLTKWRGRANKPTKEIKWNHKKYSVEPKKKREGGEKREKGEKRMNGINTKQIIWWQNYN